MRNIITITRREMQSYFVSPMAYIILFFFLLIVGFFFVQLVSVYSDYSIRMMQNPMSAGEINVHSFIFRNFYSTFGVIMLFVAPLLSMRLLAEEKRLGTAELLLTAPLSTSQLVIGKFIGALGFSTVMLAATLQYPLYLRLAGASPELGPLCAIYLGAFLMIAAFLTVGVFASSLTQSQVLAGLIAFVMCLLFWVIGWMGEAGGGQYSEFFKSLSIIEHFEDFLKGVVDTRSVVYYLSFIFFGLFLTQRVIDSGRWR